MDAGYADIDITPPPGEEMTGYGYFRNRRATGAVDALMARALALRTDDDTRAVIVQLDLLGLSKSFVATVRAEAAARYGLPGELLLLHCTHTHSGPATMPLYGCGTPSDHFLHALHGQLLTVIGKALDDLKPATAMFRFQGEFAGGFAHNRTGTSDLDARVFGVAIEFAAARPLVVLSYACHPVVLGVNREYSSDYVGAVIREFNAYGTRALYLNGCCGDINPMSNAFRFGSGTAETLLIYGRDLAAAFRRAMENKVAWNPGPLRGQSRMTPLEATPPTAAELRTQADDIRQKLAEKPDDGQTRVDLLWHEAMLRHCEQGTMHEAMEAEVQAIACGDVVFVGLSAETFTRLGWILRDSVPDRQVMIGATSNGVLGYIATRKDAEKKGYAAHWACKLYGMLIPEPGAGEKWAEDGTTVLAAVRAGP